MKVTVSAHCIIIYINEVGRCVNANDIVKQLFISCSSARNNGVYVEEFWGFLPQKSVKRRGEREVRRRKGKGREGKRK